MEHNNKVAAELSRVYFFLLFLASFPWPSVEQLMLQRHQPASLINPPLIWKEESSIEPVDCAIGLVCRCQLNHRVECSTRDTLNDIPKNFPPENAKNYYKIL